MHDERNNRPEDIVSRAVDALRRTPIPNGPAEATISQTVAAIREAANRPQNTFLQRIRAMRWSSKAAALCGLAASALVLWAVLTSPAGTSIAIAQVVEKLIAAHTLSFDMIVEAPGSSFPVTKAHLTFSEPGKMRGDFQDPNGEGTVATLISDLPAGKSILLSPKTKTAIQSLIKGSDPSMWKENMLDQLRSMAAKKAVELGEKEVDGIRAKGFELVRENVKLRIWANIETGDPLRVEVADFFLPPPFGKSSFVWSNFKLNEKLAPSFFSVDPPEGYTVIKSPIDIDFSSPPEAHVATILREYSKRMDGDFPPQIHDLGESIYKELDSRHGKADEQTAAEYARVLNPPLAQLNSYMLGHKAGTDYQYYPGVKFGETDRIVFWCRDEKTGQYTAVYGDLRVEKVEKAKLPDAAGTPQK